MVNRATVSRVLPPTSAMGLDRNPYSGATAPNPFLSQPRSFTIAVPPCLFFLSSETGERTDAIVTNFHRRLLA
jgi:hypothetical protein